jgi:ADP-ribose pyrophosphatase
MKKRGSRRRVLHEGKFVRLVRRGGWEWAERTNNSGVVVVVAITRGSRLVLTEQFRPPLDARVLDLPAGLAGDVPGTEQEELAEAARRELLEETGFQAPTLECLTEGPSSAGLTTEVVTFFLARDARRAGRGGGDPSEDIQVHAVSLGKVNAWLQRKRKAGLLIDPKIYAGLYLATGRGR